jgi:segregation and condensation protein B
METTEGGLETTQAAAATAEDADLAPLTRSIEALLFMSGDALSIEDLCELTGEEAQQVHAALDLLRAECEQRAVGINRVAGGFQMATRPEYGEVVARLLQPKRFRLSRAALETLAIVAYKQPVTRPEIEEIRGVNVDGVVETLLQYELIRECGRRRSPGRPLQYGTSDNFLIHFGLNSLQDLPDFDRLGRQDEVETEDEAQSRQEQAGAPVEAMAAEDQPAAAATADQAGADALVAVADAEADGAAADCGAMESAGADSAPGDVESSDVQAYKPADGRTICEQPSRH